MLDFYHSSDALREADPLNILLHRACLTVSKCFVLGSANKSADLKKTNQWVLWAYNRYLYKGTYIKETKRYLHKGFFIKEAMRDKTLWNFHLLPEIKKTISHEICTKNLQVVSQFQSQTEKMRNFLIFAIWSMRSRLGNCLHKSCALAYFLWRNQSPHIRNLDVMGLVHHDHAFLVINRPQNSDLEAPSTWGNDSTIVDLWFSEKELFCIYKPHEFKTRMEAVLEYLQDSKPLNTQTRLVYAIDVEKNPYSSHFDFENYDLAVYNEPASETKANYDACMQELTEKMAPVKLRL